MKDKTICTLCGKDFTELDYIDGDRNFDIFAGYSSDFDGTRFKFNFCARCFDKLLKEIIPECKVNPIIDTNWLDHCVGGDGVIHKDWGPGGSKHLTRIIVAGGLNFDDYELLKIKLDEVIKDCENVEIVSGHARGADTLGEKYAEERGLPCKVFTADWKKYGRAAGPIRNSQMIQYAKEEIPMLVAFWDGKSKGTMDTVNKAQKAGVLTVVCSYTPKDKEEA